VSLSIIPAGWTRNLCLKILSNWFCPLSLSLSHTHTHTHTNTNINKAKQYTFTAWILDNPGLLLAFVLDIPWEDIFTKWGLQVRGGEQRMKPWPTLWAWSFRFTHTFITGVLFLGSRRHYEFKSGGHLELQQRNRAPLNWYQIMGHIGPIFKA
jgi:hypothetical protein